MDVYTFVLVCVGLIGMIILLYKCKAKERTAAASHKTDVDTVGKDSEGYSEHVSATGLRTDNVGDALKAMAQTRHIRTTGMKKGSANTVEATGLDLRRRQQRPEEDKDKPMPRATTNTSVEVTENASQGNSMESWTEIFRWLLRRVFRLFSNGTDEKRKSD